MKIHDIKMTRKNRDKFSILKKRKVFISTNYKCWYCGVALTFTKYPNSTHGVIDHFVPITSGGDNTFENLKPACSKCNSAKGKKSLAEYRFSLTQKTNEAISFAYLFAAVKHFDFSNKEELQKALTEVKHAIKFITFYGETLGK